MKKITDHTGLNLLLSLLLLLDLTVRAQGTGSTSVYTGLAVATGGTQADAAETLYIGPGTYQIDGTWEIYSPKIVIDHAAVIAGSGSIVFYNHAVAGGIAGSSLVDGNGSLNAIGVKVVLQNANSAQLANLDFPSDLTAAGFTNSGSNNLYLGAELNLAVDGANVDLNGNDLIFNGVGAITDYSASRMVITGNSIAGHLVKENNSGTFAFPVGIAAGDYTPAIITGTSTYHVSVTDYNHSGATIIKHAEGMDRTWHIYGGPATNITLTHDPATDGTSYTENLSFITQYLGGSWSTGSTDYVSAGVNTSTTVGASLPATATDGAWYSKTNDPDTPLPVKLIGFEVYKEGQTAQLTWATAIETGNKGFEVERSADAKNWVGIGTVNSKAQNGNSSFRLDYSFSDNTPASGTSYYRLKQTDLDGTYQYSRFRTVRFDLQNNVYPNPASESINIEGLSTNDAINVYDLTGRSVLHIKAEKTTENIPVKNLINGIYIIEIISHNKAISSHKMIKTN